MGMEKPGCLGVFGLVVLTILVIVFQSSSSVGTTSFGGRSRVLLLCERLLVAMVLSPRASSRCPHQTDDHDMGRYLPVLPGYGHLQPLHSDILNIQSSTPVLLHQGATAAGVCKIRN